MAANVTFVLDADEAKAVAAFLKVVDAQRRTEDSAKRVGKASADAGKQQDQAFGPQAAASLMRYAASFVGIAAAVGTATRALADLQQARERAGESMRGAAEQTGRLAQLAAGDPQRLAQLQRLRDQFFVGAAAPTRGEAAAQVFSIISAGEEANLDLYRQVAGSKLETDAVQLAQAVGGLKLTFGTGETGDTRAIMNKALLASQISRTGLAQTLQATARTGQFARLAGVGDEEAFAATAAALSALGPGEGETQIRAFMKFLAENPRFRGGGLVGAAEQIQGMNLRPEQLTKMLGETRAVGGFNIVQQNAELIRQKAAELESRQGEGVLESAIATNLTNPEIASTRMRQIAQAREEMTTEALGIRNQLADAILAEQQAGERAGGRRGEFDLWMGRRTAGAKRFLMGDEAFIQGELEFNRGFFGANNPDIERLTPLLDAANSLENAAREQHRASRTLGGDRNAHVE